MTNVSSCYVNLKIILFANGRSVHYLPGGKINKTGSQVKLLDANGWTASVHISSEGSELPSSAKLLYEHFKLCWKHCLNLEKALDSTDPGNDGSCYPAILGKKPTSSGASLHTSNKENTSPISVVSIQLFAAYLTWKLKFRSFIVYGLLVRCQMTKLNLSGRFK